MAPIFAVLENNTIFVRRPLLEVLALLTFHISFGMVFVRDFDNFTAVYRLTKYRILTIYVILFVALAFAILDNLNIPKVTVMKIDQHDDSIFNSVLIVLVYILPFRAFENQTIKSIDFHSRFGPGSKRLTNTNYRQRKSKFRMILLHVEKSWTSGGGVWFH